jgi:hypothetical protein
MWHPKGGHCSMPSPNTNSCYMGCLTRCLCVTTLALGSWPRQRLAKVWAKSEAQESHFMLPRGWEMGECENWTSTLPNELPLWELESRWTPKFSESDFKGQNPLDWGVLYNIRKFLERKCQKWACIIHLDIWNTSYGQKKGRESNCKMDSRPLKIWNRPYFLACRWRTTYCWKAFDKGYNFASDLISIKALNTKLWPGKIVEVPTLRISKLPRTKWHLGASPWPSTNYTIRGKVVTSPKSGPWWILWIRVACGSS